MNILFVAYHTCARAAKEARALEKAGHQVIILQHVAASEEILYATELSSFFNSDSALRERVHYFADWAEVIHVHNEPNWIVSAAASQRDMSCPHIPVIFDIHDLESMRESGEIDLDETPAFDSADGFIFPSRSYEKGVRAQRNLGLSPSRVIYSMCSRDDIVDMPLPRVNGLVYEGATVAPVAAFNEKSKGWKGYRDYVRLAACLTDSGVPFHLYGVRKEFHGPYLRAGAIVHESLPFSGLLRQLSRFDWGLCGHLDNHPQWQKAMPNKLFEYLAAGIPVISINAGEVTEFLAKHGLGGPAESMSQITAVLNDKTYNAAIREHVQANRHKFTMETQVPEIEALYAEAAAYRQDKFDGGVWMRPVRKVSGVDRPWICSPRPEDFAKDNGGGDQPGGRVQPDNGRDKEAVQGELRS